jgi:transcriptional regulator with XRE-family HTH domain
MAKDADPERTKERERRKERKARFLKRLGLHVGKLRRSKGYSMDRLALEADLSRATMSRIEKGAVDPQAFTLESIAVTLGIKFSELVNF